jgi:OmpA-OmpF porin, OOP family
MKKLFLCLCILFSFFYSKAQTSVAIVGGLQKTSISPDFLVYPDTLQKSETQKTGAVVGIVANIPLKKNFFIRTGVIYSSKGSNWTQFYDTTDLYARTKDLALNKKETPFSTNTKLNVNYIDIPLNIMYKLPFKNNSGLVIGVGPQASIFYNGNSSSFSINVSQDSATESSVKTSVKEVKNNDLPIGKLSKTYRVVHFGVNAFLGVEFNRVFFNINYAKGLNEFYEEEGRKFKHQAVGLSMGIFLGQRPLAKNKKTS